MNKSVYKLLVICFFTSIHAGFAQSDVTELLSKATLVFEDNFNRQEEDDTKEQLGKNWKTNSKNRAEGHKQADLRNNVLFVKMWKDAAHGTSVLHRAPIKNGIVQVKFKMLSVNKRGKAIEFNFHDPKSVAVNGHICQVMVDPKELKIEDQFSGRFHPELRKKYKSGEDKEAVRKELIKYRSLIPVNYELNKWYQITMVFIEDTLSVYIDGAYVGEHTSPGFKALKDDMAFALWYTQAEFDDFQVWSLN